MASMTVHSVPGSPFGRAVLATLEEKAAPYRLLAVSPATLREPEHLSRHPFGRVPTLDHDGFRLYETQAIMRYLDRVLPNPALTPANPNAAARMDQVMNVVDWYLFQGVGNVIGFQRIVGPRILGLTPNEAAIDAAMPRAHMVFNELAQLLGDWHYFAGETVSLADLSLASHLDFLAHTPEWSLLGAPHANLVTWLARMNAKPSMAATTWDRVAAIAQAA